MKAIVVFDSYFGCTQQIASAISETLISLFQTSIFKVSDIKPNDLDGLDLLIVGSPTRGFRPTNGISGFLKSIPSKGLMGVKIAAFDTRITMESIESSVFRFIVKAGGYAAKPISEKLVKRGGVAIVPPEGFFVTGEEGPLGEGEVARAQVWARGIVSMIQTNYLSK